MKQTVAVVKTKKAAYPDSPPYHPSEEFPEYPFGNALAGNANYVYRATKLCEELVT